MPVEADGGCRGLPDGVANGGADKIDVNEGAEAASEDIFGLCCWDCWGCWTEATTAAGAEVWDSCRCWGRCCCWKRLLSELAKNLSISEIRLSSAFAGIEPAPPDVGPLDPEAEPAVEAATPEFEDDWAGGLRSWKAIKSSRISDNISSFSSESGGRFSYTETLLEVEADVEVADWLPLFDVYTSRLDPFLLVLLEAVLPMTCWSRGWFCCCPLSCCDSTCRLLVNIVNKAEVVVTL